MSQIDEIKKESSQLREMSIVALNNVQRNIRLLGIARRASIEKAQGQPGGAEAIAMIEVEYQKQRGKAKKQVVEILATHDLFNQMVDLSLPEHQAVLYKIDSAVMLEVLAEDFRN